MTRRPFRTKEGERLHKRMFVKVVVQGKVQPHNFTAPAGKGYTEQEMDETRERVVDYLDHRFPYFDFKEVQIAPNAWNYIATRTREVPKGAPTDAKRKAALADRIQEAIDASASGNAGTEHAGDSGGNQTGESDAADQPDEQNGEAGGDGSAERSAEDNSAAAESSAAASGTAANTSAEREAADGVDCEERLHEQGPQTQDLQNPLRNSDQG